MNKKDRERIHGFYQDALRTYGENDARALHWTDVHNQTRRFDILLGVADLHNQSVLDVGCGLGDLYQYMNGLGIKTNYTGIDIVPEFIRNAKKRYPETDFSSQDIFEIEKHYDYVLSSGALSFKVEDHKNFYFTMIKKMYTVANKGVAFNMLDNENHIDNDTYAAYSPKEVSGFCGTFADRVEVAIGYLPQDFTVYLYKI